MEKSVLITLDVTAVNAVVKVDTMETGTLSVNVSVVDIFYFQCIHNRILVTFLKCLYF